MWVLVVEDEASMRAVVCQGLREAHHTVTEARDGGEALAALATAAYDAVLLDLMLPVASGLHVLREVRAANNHVPVVVVTARDGSDDVVSALDAGADDYLVKPFAFDVLLARLRAISRRASSPPIAELRVADLVLAPSARAVRRGATILSLTATEYRLLEFLMRRTGRAVSRSSIIDGVWGQHAEIENNTVDAFVKLLRAKVDCQPGPRLIHTIRSFGYILREE
ncbi:MAG: response regulator transcription factor [Acidobacteriota bacterium]